MNFYAFGHSFRVLHKPGFIVSPAFAQFSFSPRIFVSLFSAQVRFSFGFPALAFPSIPFKPANAESGGSGRYFLTLKKRCTHTVRMTIYAIFSAHLYIYSLQLFKSFALPRKTAAFHRCSGPAPGTGGASAVSRGDLAPELSFLNPHSKILL